MLRLLQRSRRLQRVPFPSQWHQCAERHRSGRLAFLGGPQEPSSKCRPSVLNLPPARGLATDTSTPEENHESSPPAPLVSTPPPPSPAAEQSKNKDIPFTCPGCGAYSQTVDPELPGFYNPKKKKAVKEKRLTKRQEDAVFMNALRLGILPGRKDSQGAPIPLPPVNEKPPVCDRCHNLIYQHRGSSVVHPSMDSIRAIIEESPHQHNHIYHVLDAADFPMSLIPNLQSALRLPRLRSQNRRSKSVHYIRGRMAEVTFIITRADLLAPKKEMVDRMVPLLREILRDAMGRSGEKLRLGNVRCVSALSGWWTPTVKEEIYKRGGAGWMVGKVNVGKSALYKVVFPKGRNQPQDVDVQRIRLREKREQLEAIREGTPELSAPAEEVEVDDAEIQEDDGRQVESDLSPPASENEMENSTQQDRPEVNTYQESELLLDQESQSQTEQENEFYDENDEDEDLNGSLLPPARKETEFPHMPIASTLAGTTAAPIRIPFGNGKGELIDLPGIQRSSLTDYIDPKHHPKLVMKSRVVPEQYTIKPGQSLTLGGVIRITPKTDELIFLAYPFVPEPLDVHIAAHDKMIGLQTGWLPTGEPYNGNVPSIATEDAKKVISSAGTFKLRWDVTKARTGALTDPVAGKQKVASLPFTVYGADLLIEGVGWVELVCQTRKRRQEGLAARMDALWQRDDVLDEELPDRDDVSGSHQPPVAYPAAAAEDEPDLPEVEVWTPKGKFIGLRRPLNAWVTGGPKKVPVHKQIKRPRQSISMQRRKEGGAKGKKAASRF